MCGGAVTAGIVPLRSALNQPNFSEAARASQESCSGLSHFCPDRTLFHRSGGGNEAEFQPIGRRARLCCACGMADGVSGGGGNGQRACDAAGRAELREVIVTGPFSFKTFIDRLSVQAPVVTLAGGDTLNFHLALAPPSRFAISMTADVFSVGVEMQSSADGTPVTRSGSDPTVVLLAPDHDLPPGAGFTTYSVDSASGRVMSLSAVQQYGARRRPSRLTSRRSHSTGSTAPWCCRLTFRRRRSIAGFRWW